MRAQAGGKTMFGSFALGRTSCSFERCRRFPLTASTPYSDARALWAAANWDAQGWFPSARVQPFSEMATRCQEGLGLRFVCDKIVGFIVCGPQVTGASPASIYRGGEDACATSGRRSAASDVCSVTRTPMRRSSHQGAKIDQTIHIGLRCSSLARSIAPAGDRQEFEPQPVHSLSQRDVLKLSNPTGAR